MEELTRIGKNGKTEYKNNFCSFKNKWINLGQLLIGLSHGALKLSNLPPGLKAEYDKWDKKRRAEIAASDGEE